MKRDRRAEIGRAAKKDEAEFKPSLGLMNDRAKVFELLDKHLEPCGNDLVLLTLTGHLVIESLLELILIRQLDLDRLPDEHPLEFSQKLDLVKALVIGREPKPKADLLCAIGKLNSVRNRLAHTLMSSTEVEKAVKSIIDSYHSKANSKLDRNETLPVQLKSCISKLCKFLNRVIFHFYNLEQQKVDLLGEQMK